MAFWKYGAEGGESLTVPILTSAIKDFTATGKPFYTLSHLAGSAAYWGTLPSTAHYVSSEASRVGSIGAFLRVDTQMLKYFKENTMEFYAPESTDKNDAIRALMGGDPSKMYTEASKLAQLFQMQVSEHRELAVGTKESTLAGGLFYGANAIERGMVDGIKTLNELISDIATGNTATSISQTQNSDVMNLNDFGKAIVTQFNRIFGLSMAEDSAPEAITQALTGIKPISEQLAEQLASMNDLVKQNTEALKTAQAEIASLKDNAPDVQTLNDRIATLEASETTLKEQNAKLSKEVLTLKTGKPAEDHNGDNPYTGAAKTFMDQLGNVTVEGESKMTEKKS